MVNLRQINHVKPGAIVIESYYIIILSLKTTITNLILSEIC